MRTNIFTALFLPLNKNIHCHIKYTVPVPISIYRICIYHILYELKSWVFLKLKTLRWPILYVLEGDQIKENDLHLTQFGSWQEISNPNALVKVI